MMWILGLIAVGIIATGAFLASGKFGEMPDLVDDHPVPRLPEGEFTAADVQGLHFGRALRGYAPHEVDELMARVARSLTQDASGRPVPVTPAELHAATFEVVTSGYHMGQVDLVVERLADQLAGTTRRASWNDTE